LSGFLLDTSIISQLSPAREPPRQLVRWLRVNRSRISLSVISVIEIEKGIARLRRLGGSRRADDLSAWLDELLDGFAERVHPVDVPAARLAGSIGDRVRAEGRDPGLADVVIAATALSRGLAVATRNVRHFEPLGVASVDPLDAREE
jgi:predicted nucleic acid-binding protein